MVSAGRLRCGPVAEESEIEAVEGEGYAVANIDDLGEGWGFRKIRKGLGVTAFGVNAIVLPPSYETGRHYHDEQEELYFLHRGQVEIEFGDGTSTCSSRAASPGSTLRPCAGYATSATAEDAVYVVGGKDGYVGRDG